MLISANDRQFCLDQQLPICKDASKGQVDPDTATGQEGDVQTKCFRASELRRERGLTVSDVRCTIERDSALSYTVVIFFILITTSLLIGAAIKDRLPESAYRGGIASMWNVSMHNGA